MYGWAYCSSVQYPHLLWALWRQRESPRLPVGHTCTQGRLLLLSHPWCTVGQEHLAVPVVRCPLLVCICSVRCYQLLRCPSAILTINSSLCKYLLFKDHEGADKLVLSDVSMCLSPRHGPGAGHAWWRKGWSEELQYTNELDDLLQVPLSIAVVNPLSVVLLPYWDVNCLLPGITQRHFLGSWGNRICISLVEFVIYFFKASQTPAFFCRWQRIISNCCKICILANGYGGS